MTNKYQPLDSTINKRMKAILKNCYNSWCSQQVMDQLSTGVSPTEIKIKQPISIIKPLHAGWIINAYEDLRSEAGIASILKGFANCYRGGRKSRECFENEAKLKKSGVLLNICQTYLYLEQILLVHI